MPGSQQVESVQGFLDGPGRTLRQVAFLVTGSWTAADDALGLATGEALRRGADPDDQAALERQVARGWAHHLLSRSDEATLVDERHDATEPADRLLQALDVLPPDERLALVLDRFAHLGVDRAAAVMGLDEAGTAALLATAREHLASELARTGDRLADEPADDHGYRRPAGDRQPSSTTGECVTTEEYED